MGAKFVIENGYVNGVVKKKVERSKYFFKKISVGATENIIMAATLAEGKTVIRNAAKEPEIEDLCKFFIKIGANIDRLWK